MCSSYKTAKNRIKFLIMRTRELFSYVLALHMLNAHVHMLLSLFAIHHFVVSIVTKNVIFPMKRFFYCVLNLRKEIRKKFFPYIQWFPSIDRVLCLALEFLFSYRITFFVTLSVDTLSPLCLIILRLFMILSLINDFHTLPSRNEKKRNSILQSQ